MMRFIFGLALLTTCFLPVGNGYGQLLSGGAPGAGAARGAASGATGGVSGAARSRSRAAVRVPGRETNPREVGPHFDARGDAAVRGGASLRAGGLRASGAAGASVDVQMRRRQARRDREQGSEAESRRNESRGSGALEHNPGVLRADLFLATRLAEIDRLRDTAVATGDTSLLIRADRLEQDARAVHHSRVQQAAGGEVSGEGRFDRRAIYGSDDLRAESRFAGESDVSVGGNTRGDYRLEGRGVRGESDFGGQYQQRYEAQFDTRDGYETSERGVRAGARVAERAEGRALDYGDRAVGAGGQAYGRMEEEVRYQTRAGVDYSQDAAAEARGRGRSAFDAGDYRLRGVGQAGAQMEGEANLLPRRGEGAQFEQPPYLQRARGAADVDAAGRAYGRVHENLEQQADAPGSSEMRAAIERERARYESRLQAEGEFDGESDVEGRRLDIRNRVRNRAELEAERARREQQQED